jgi:hypothetical protein
VSFAFVLLLNECLLLFVSLSTQSGKFLIHPRISGIAYADFDERNVCRVVLLCSSFDHKIIERLQIDINLSKIFC